MKCSQFRMQFFKAARFAGIALLLILSLLFAFAVHAAPVKVTGNSLQAELNDSNREITYSFDHVGGYAIDGGGQSVSLDDTFAAVSGWEDLLRETLDAWGAVADITFVEVPDSGDDFNAPDARGTIRFSSHPMNKYAHGFYPPSSDQTESQTGYSGWSDIHFSTNEDWTPEKLNSVAAHELGHSLGFSHNLDPNSIMYPFHGIKEAFISKHDESNVRALSFPVNSPADVFVGDVLEGEHDWLALTDATVDNRRQFLLDEDAHINTTGEQKTGIKGTGASLSIENYAFDYVNLTAVQGSRIDTTGHNAYGIAAGDHNSILMNGTITTQGFSADGIAFLGGGNALSTGTESVITTFGDGANAIFMGIDYANGYANIVTANGTIDTYGAGGCGILYHDSSWISLSGAINTQGHSAAGISSAEASYASITIAEDGSIVTAGEWAYGVLLYGRNNVAASSGSITTQGKNGYGILAYGNENTVTSNGSITTQGKLGYGIMAGGNENILINHGSIRTEGVLGHGLVAALGSNILFHSGVIAVSGLDTVGILVRESGNQIDLAGTVSSEQAQAVRVGTYWNNQSEVLEQTDNTGNRLFVHGSPQIIGDIVNDGAPNGAAVFFGASYDPNTDGFAAAPETTLVFDDNFRGRSWLADLHAGSVVLNGNNAFSRLDIRTDAHLSGNGSVQGSVYNYGDINPGNSMGTFSISGDYVQGATGQLSIDIASAAEYDKLKVEGSASLDGAFQARFLENYRPAHGDQFAVLEAAGISGTFLDHPYGNLTPTLILTTLYHDTRVLLEIERNYQNPNLLSHLNANQAELAATLDVKARSATEDLDAVLTKIDALGSYNQAARAFDELSIKGSAAQMRTILGIANAQTSNLAQRLSGVRSIMGPADNPGEVITFKDNPLKGVLLASMDTDLTHLGIYNSPTNKDMGLFFTASSIFGKQDPSENQNGYDFATTILSFGADRRFSDNLILGVFGGIHRTDTDINDTGSKSKNTGGSFGVYGTGQWKSFYLDGAICYGLNHHENFRRIVFPGLDRTARTDTDGSLFSLYAGMGSSFDLSDWDIAPYAVVQYVSTIIEDYAETGAGSLNLSVDLQKIDVIQPGIGAQISRTYVAAFGELIPSFFASVQRRYGDDESIVTARLAYGQTPRFSVLTDGVDDIFGRLGAGFIVGFKNNAKIKLAYTVVVGDSDYREHEVLLKIRLVF